MAGHAVRTRANAIALGKAGRSFELAITSRCRRVFADAIGRLRRTRRDERIGRSAAPARAGVDPVALAHSGRIYKFSPPGGTTTTFPQTLSATGLFQNTANLTPSAGVIEYDVKAKLWSDNAKKKRWIALPGTSRITWSASGNWQFPTGTVLVKHFGLEMTVGNPGTERKLETRVFIREQAGWAGYTYRWNSAQTDANLLTTGEFQTYTIRDASAPGGPTTAFSWIG